MVRKPPALAKIAPPRLHDVLARTRLFDAIDAALQRPVAWLCAQPGAGKTTLVASYLQARAGSRGGHALWIQLDDGDADPASFVYHLRLAVEAMVSPRAAAALPLLTPEYMSDLRGFARRFFRALYAQVGDGAVLVLDNFQDVPEDAAAFHGLIVEAIAQLPPAVHLIAISRAEPPQAYAVPLASGAIALLDAQLLRLTLTETEGIANRRGVEDPAAIAALHERSHGWAAGLSLLLARARDRSDPLADDADSLQHVFAYFAQRVFDDLGATPQRALMQLAFLPQMDGAQVQRLTAEPEAPRLLERLHRRHLFVDRRRVAGATAHPVFQFHALFRTFLRHQALAQWGEEGCRDVARRAGRLLIDDGMHEQALECFGQAKDWASHGRTLIACAEGLIELGRGQTVVDWLARMPVAERAAMPWLAYWEGRALLPTAPERALQALQGAYQHFEADSDATGQFACGAAIVQTLWYARLGWSEIAPWVNRLEPLLEASVALPTPSLELFSYAALHAAVSFCRLSHPGVLPLARRLLALIDRDDIDWNQRLLTATHLMAWLHNAAELDLVNQLIARVDPVIDARPASALNRSFWFTFRAIHDMRHGRDVEATQRFERAESLARDNALVHAEFAAMQFHCYLDILCRRGDEVRARLARMEVHPARGHPDAELHFNVAHAQLAQLQGRSADSLAYAHRALAAVDAVGAAAIQVHYSVSVASNLADGGDVALARAVIAHARTLAHGGYLQVVEAQLLLEEAYVAIMAGDAAAADALLRQGLSLAAADRAQAAYLHRIVVRRPRLLEAALRAGIEVDFVRTLIRRWRLPPPRDEPAAWPWPLRVRTLGAFEVLVHDQPIAFGRKAPKKTLALLKALIARGGGAPDSALVDQFWPDEDGDAAAKSLGAALYRLRTLLGVPEAVVQLGGQVSLDRELVWVDAWAFERGLGAPQPQAVIDALALYRGIFLVEEEGESWPVATRERLRGKFVKAVADHASSLEAMERHEDAIAWYQKGLDADNVVEPFYQGLMRCYQRLERLPEALSAYQRCRQILSATLSLPPSPGTEKLYQALRLGQPDARDARR